MSCTDRLREALAAWVAGELEAPEAARVAAHVAECPECAALAESLREIVPGEPLLGGLQPPGGLRETLSGSPCRRWQESLMAALDHELPEERLAPLVQHLEECPACAAVWQAFAAIREVGPVLVPPEGLEARCSAVPGIRTAGHRLPGLKAAMAAAYALALALSLLVGNPVTLAHQQVRSAAGHLERTVRTHAAVLHDEGRGELRMFVWRLWRIGSGAAEAVREAFRPLTPPGNETTRNGDRA